MLTIFTCTEEPSGAETFSGLWPRVKRLHLSAACFILRKKGAMPLTGVLLSYLCLNTLGSVIEKGHWKLVRSCKESTHNKRIDRSNITYCAKTHTRRECG